MVNVSIEHINQRLPIIRSSDSTGGLRDGQIIRGQILKLYPNHKAMIQIGLKKLVAQLETPLTLGDKYHFQVNVANDIIYLRMLGEKLTEQSAKNSSTLLKQLNLKTTKDNVTFIQSLLSDNIPFNGEQLKKALTVLDQSHDKEHAQQTLKRMLVANLPITKSVLDALMSQGKNQLANQLQQLQQNLTQQVSLSPFEQYVSNYIKQLIGLPSNTTQVVENEVLFDMTTNKTTFFNALKLSGMIEPEVNYGEWGTNWKSNLSQSSASSSFTTGIIEKHDYFLFNNKNIQDVISAFTQIKKNQESLFDLGNQWEHLFTSRIAQSVQSQSPLSTSEYQQMKRFISHEVLPLLPELQQEQLAKSLKNEPQSFVKLMKIMELLQDNQIYRRISHFLAQIGLSNDYNNQSEEQRVYQYMRNFANMVGLSYENQVAENMNSQLDHTLKGLLLQLTHQNQSEAPILEHSTKILNIINGLQLQSVNEINNIIYAYLQFPGDKLGLANEVNLKFEGKKKNGHIDSDYCRIHFFLDLNHLKETIIDMNVQNRSVTVTVYNDLKELKSMSTPFIGLLKESLESLKYRLSTVLFKPLSAKTDQKNTLKNSTYETYTQGMDYRI